MALDASVRNVMRRINKEHGEGSVILGSEIKKAVRQTITSGSLSLDAALGGGWATSHWIEIVGWESTGKTFLVLKTIAANQKRDPEFTTVWFATEDFNEDYAVMLGVDLERVIVINENIMEDIFQQAKEFIDTKAIDCMVIDSLPFLVSSREDDGTMEDTQPGYAAILTGKFFRKAQGGIKRRLDLAEERTCTGFVINGWRDRIGVKYGDPRTTPGGKGKNFVFFQRVDISRVEWITDTKRRPVGQVMKIKNVKNKYARPGLTGEVDAYLTDYRGHRAGSFDTTKDVVSAALAYEVITKESKLRYVFGDEGWNGRPKLDAAVRGDGRLRARIRKAVLAAAADPMPPTTRPPRKAAPSAKRRPTKSVAKTRAASSKAPRRKTAPRVRVGE